MLVSLTLTYLKLDLSLIRVVCNLTIKFFLFLFRYIFSHQIIVTNNITHQNQAITDLFDVSG